jgi:hypothetical protein
MYCLFWGDKLENLCKQWRLFLEVIFDPWNLFLIISVGALFYNSVNQTNILASTLLFILITLASAILGGRIAKQWTDLTEGSIAIARGRSAVRSLKLLLRLITALEKRISEFRFNESEIEKYPEVTKRNYEEAIETCKQLQEQTVNSIENWTDIVPEADIKTEIGVISDLKDKLKSAANDLAKLNLQIQEVEGKSAKEISQMQSQILAKEGQIMSLERDIKNKDRLVGLGEIGLLGNNTLSFIENSKRLSSLARGHTGGMVERPKVTDKN